MLFQTVNSPAHCAIDSNANNGRMAEKTISKNTIETEAAAWKKLFDERVQVSQERFGLEIEIGSQGMVRQYLNAHRPLNLSVALKFARGLGVPVERFSARLAAELRAAGIEPRRDELQAAEPLGITIKQIPVVGTARGGEDSYY